VTITGKTTGSRVSTRSPPLLMTKLHPPTRREQTISRDRLVARLNQQAGVKLTVVAAPAGCGKTTLLGMWREAEAAVKPVAWLTVDADDNDVAVLWSHVIEALRRASPGFGESLPRRVGESTLQAVLRQIVNDLAEQREIALILDDFHRLSSGAARDSIAWLIEHAPSTFHLVIASRSEPGLPLAPMRAHAELTEVRADELGFTASEASTLLNDRLNLDLTPREVERLVERIEGWPAGIYLAGLSLGGVHDRHSFVESFGATSKQVVEFLVDEVLDAHDPKLQTLMLGSSVLGRLCGPLCDAVLGQEGSGELLAELSRTNLFLVPLDDHGEWYRFHHLFAQLLRVELENREPGLAPLLHERASVWHRDHGSLDEATEHAIEGESFAAASRLISAAWPTYANAGAYATVLGWLDRFPPELMQDDQSLLLAAAWVYSSCAKRDAAAAAMARVEELGDLHSGPLSDGFTSAAGSLATLRAALPWGDVGAGLRAGFEAERLEGPDAPHRASVCWALGMGWFFAGDYDEADRWFTQNLDLARRTPVYDGARRPPRAIRATSSLAYRSLIAGERGHLDEQAQLARQSVDMARELGHEDVISEVTIAAAVSLAACGRVDEARPLFERAVLIARRWGQPLDLANALLYYASTLRALGETEDFASTIAEARAVVDSCPDPGILEQRRAALEQHRRPRRDPGSEALTDRELVILRMLRGTLSEREIGRELYLSHNTVHSHTKSIYRKLAASSRSEALDNARAIGLI
jgi:ATP/maltotriose-dependent transcriptional regulator MalT